MKWPKVSCICVTRNRRVFLDLAVKYFQRAMSKYPSTCCMVIVDGSVESRMSTSEVWEWGSYVRYFHEPNQIGNGLGNARNRACEASEGADIIVQWDDDDWQHPDRITRQVQELLQSPGDGLACTSSYYWYHIEQRQAVKAKGSVGATFAYWRNTWKKTPFRDVLGEDIPFQGELRDRGCPLLDMRDPELVVYMRHNQNGSALTNYQWNEEDSQACRKLMGPDVDFYDGLAELLPVAHWTHPNAPGSKMHVMNPLQQQWGRHFK